MSYDNVNNFVQSYAFPFTNASAIIGAIRAPTQKGIRFAVIEDIQFGAAVGIVNTTTAMQALIGTAGTAGKYAAQNASALTGLAAGLAYGVADLDGRVAAFNPAATPSATNKGFIDLLADGDVAGTLQSSLKVSTTVGVGTPAGSGTLNITIRWF